MKIAIFAFAAAVVLGSVPASASIAPTKETASHGVPFCQKFPDVCAAWCVQNPDRLMCHAA